MSSRLAEILNICEGFLPVNMATAANNGDWVNMKDYGTLGILLFKGVGTASEDPTITVQQGTSAAGADAKALNFTTIWKKQAATNLQSTTTWTKVTQTAANTFTHADLAEQAAIILIQIDAEELDVGGGFCFVQAAVADVGSSSQIGGLLYLLADPRFPQASLPTAIS